MENTIALAGNPNCGKTTMFNALTGARQHVGNYPGVTVEKKEGLYVRNGYKFTVVDLPGTYSLTAYSLEEVVARDFLVNEKPALVVNIVDASNLERNLYLAVQFMEMGIPICIALNMVDVAEKRGIRIDLEKLSQLLGVPIVPTVARGGKGITELMDTAAESIQNKKQAVIPNISYGMDIDPVLARMTRRIEEKSFLTGIYPAHWTALKYLENDEQIREIGQKVDPDLARGFQTMVDRLTDHIKKTLDSYPEAIIADYRYGYIKSILGQGVVSFQEDMNRLFLSDKIDRVVTQRLFGPLIMTAAILGLYHFTFTYSKVPAGWVENLFGWLGGMAETYLADGLLKSLIISGIIDGVGGVLGFAPLIMFMFFGIALLEDSGYLARVAYMLDRIFHAFGLHGSSVMAFIVSGGIAGGCAVPGVMATRTLKSPRERLATLLTVPFMNCGAKLPVFALIIAAFFTRNEAMMMMLITAVSWIGALLAAKLLRTTVIKGDSTPFVMELPPYRLPTFKGLLIHTWERTWQYIKKAGTVILAISVVLWAMMTFPRLPEHRINQFVQEREGITAATLNETINELARHSEETALSNEARALKQRLQEIDVREAEAALLHSVAGRMGTTLEPISRLAGFDWRTNIALVGGFAAKEVVVSTLGTAYSLGNIDPEKSEPLSEKLASTTGWSPLVGLSLIVFIIFYSPCFVAVVCIAREAGTWKWGAFSMLFNTALAFLFATAVYQFGKFIGF